MEITIACDVIHPANKAHYGSESQYATLAEAMVKQGHTVNFLAAEGSTPVGNFFPYECSKGDAVASLQIEAKMFEDHDVLFKRSDLVIDVLSRLQVSDFYALEGKKPQGTILWSLNGNTPVLQAFPSNTARKMWHGVLLSQLQKTLAVQTAGHNPSMVDVIYYGIDVETYKPVTNPTRDYFLFISRPTPDKGIFTFLRYAADFPKEKFVMAFDMEAYDHKLYGRQAIRIAEDLSNVTYIPLNQSLEKKVELYANAKALFIPLGPNYIEIMGLVFMESLSCGTPCITAGHGGQVELLTPEVSFTEGFGDYRNAIKNVDKLDYSKCRPLILNKYSSDIWAKNYVTLAEKIITENK